MSEESLEQKLNRLAKSANLKVPKHALDFLPWGDATSTTTLFDKDTESAFELNSPVVGTVKIYSNSNPKHIVPDDYRGPIGIHRALISYSMASRIENETDLVQSIMPVLISGMRDLVDNFGDLSKYSLTIRRPSYEHEYIVFREMENHAAFEIRILVERW